MRDVEPSHSLLAVLIVLCVAGPGAEVEAGEIWWSEYTAQVGDELLLHFGRPQKSRGQAAVRRIQQQRKKDPKAIADDLEKLLGEDSGPAVPEELPRIKSEDLNTRPGPIDDTNVPPGVVLDYGDNRRKFGLTEGGPVVAPEGRFGAGLKCAGAGGLVCREVKYTRRSDSHGGVSMECWFKADRRPDKESCILSFRESRGGPGGRILLRPDGRVELRMDHPHGHVSPKAPPKLLQLIRARKTEIASPDPVPAGRWTHVVACVELPVVQGVGQPSNSILLVNGVNVANFLTAPGGAYRFMGRGGGTMVVGNSQEMDQPFEGVIDEVRISSTVRTWYPLPRMPWRDAERKRPLRFGPPYFRADRTVFHASLDNGWKYDIDKSGSGQITFDGEAPPLESLLVDGIRGKGWTIDPSTGFPRFSIRGLSPTEGALEFWVRAANWDTSLIKLADYKLPEKEHKAALKKLKVSGARFYGTDKRDGKIKLFMEVDLKDKGLSPSRWRHLTVQWTPPVPPPAQATGKRRTPPPTAWVYVDASRNPFGGVRRADADLLANVQPLYVEFGVPKEIQTVNDEAALMQIDEVVGYSAPMPLDEVARARDRWMGDLEPIENRKAVPRMRYKFSIGQLTFSLAVQDLPGAARVRASLVSAESGKRLRGPFEQELKDGKAEILVCDRSPLPYGRYRVDYEILDAKEKVLAREDYEWSLRKEAWRDSRAGILTKTPPPWTPVKVSGRTIETRMTRYALGPGGLPKEIFADGVNLLARPVRLVEDGKAMQGGSLAVSPSNDVDATWRSRFTGRTCDVEMQCKIEYDGMVRFELRVRPKGEGKVGRLAFEIPMKSDLANRYMYVPAGRTGASTGVIGETDGVVLRSRDPGYGSLVWRAKRGKKPYPKFEDYHAYAFCNQLDVNDMNRGIYWFADNAAGWSQSKTVDAQTIIREGDTVSMVLNLVAEPVDYKEDRPIVFGILPHPARPLAKWYRKLDRASWKEDPLVCTAYGSAFMPWVMEPRDHGMKVFPRPDPRNPDAGASYDYARRCGEYMRLLLPYGCRTMYLSRYWLSCRAGAYDGWEWRCGPSGQATMCKSFVDYLCWEMDQWIAADVWDAIYLDEIYEAPTRNVEAGHAVRLPDGSVQAGEMLFGFRELMKRWRGIFHQRGKTPMLTVHLTRSFPYCAVVFCDSYLDGEGAPTVTAYSRDFVDAVALHRAEVIQNGAMWGVVPFYMVCIWEGGLGKGKGWNPHTRWSWRMGRGAMSVLAHFENGEMYTDQGGGVYRHYWNDVFRWGGSDPDAAAFYPYWKNGKYLRVVEPESGALVSFYKHSKTGKVLLIASNRGKGPRDIKIQLNLGALGLPETPRVVNWDTGYPPSKGEDILSRKELDELRATMTDGEGLSFEDGVGEDVARMVERIKQEKDEQESSPRFADGLLVLPTRPHDFRMVSLE